MNFLDDKLDTLQCITIIVSIVSSSRKLYTNMPRKHICSYTFANVIRLKIQTSLGDVFDLFCIK